MDGKGHVVDNIMVDRLWRAVKCEDIHIRDYENVEELVKGIRMYFEFYNNERLHQIFGGRTPAELYGGISELRKAA